MSAKALREHRGKKLLARHVKELSNGKHVIDDRSVLITSATDLDALPKNEPWLLESQDDDDDNSKLVVKPDQLIKRRGKAGLVGIKLSWEEVKEWIKERMDTEITVDGTVKGQLNTFIVDPFVPHEQSDEYYICIQSDRDGEEILFYSEGGEWPFVSTIYPTLDAFYHIACASCSLIFISNFWIPCASFPPKRCRCRRCGL